MKYKRIGEYSQKAIRWKKAYIESDTYTTLWDCYKVPSWEKIHAYENCVKEMLAEKGWAKRIISHNTMQFTFAYLFDDFETGVYLRVITKSHNYEILWNPF